jgi:hypothetical protein
MQRHRNAMLGALAVALFFAAWQAIFLVVPLNPLFFTTPTWSKVEICSAISPSAPFHSVSAYWPR